MSRILDPDRDEDFLAAEYALGMLSSAEMRRAERRLRTDPAFAEDVAAWQARLSPMIDAVPDRAPPESVWVMVEKALPRRPAATAAPVKREGGRRVAAFWQWLALGSSAVAVASLAALLILPGPVSVSGPAMTAAITSDASGMPLFAVVLDPATHSATLVPIRLDIEPGRVPELWLVREGGAPQSLGVFDPDAPLRMAVSPGMMSGDLAGGQLAISMEPEGGSPTGQPTGPVLGHGALRSI